MPRMKPAVINLALSLASLLIFVLLAELVLFRLVLPPSDVPVNAMVDDVIRFRPNQTGVWRVRDEIAAPFAVNGQGWNSGRGDYRTERTPSVGRIAIVGDSFVEALQVPATASLAEKLEESLKPQAWEVYRFGVSGAPLSQYLFMLEREVARYRPDLVVVVLVHNDFDESYRFQQGRYTSSFLKLAMQDGQVAGEIAPAPYAPPAWDWLRRSATAGYFYYRQQVSAGNLRAFFLAAPPLSDAPAAIQANIEIAPMREALNTTRAATDYLFRRMAGWAKANHAQLLLLMDGDRQAIYANTASGALELNALAAELAAQNGISFIDLHPRFAADWAAQHQRFDFEADNHWNERGHAVAAAAIQEFLKSRPMSAN